MTKPIRRTGRTTIEVDARAGTLRIKVSRVNFGSYNEDAEQLTDALEALMIGRLSSPAAGLLDLRKPDFDA